MTGHLVSGLIVATLIAVGAFGSTGADATAAQPPPHPVYAASDTRVMSADASGMVALQRHAQVDMLLYSGSFGGGELASARIRATPVALTLPAGTR